MRERKRLEPIPIDPLIDPVFKVLFGTEENKDLLQDFINAVLERIDVPRAVSIELVPTRHLRRRATEKETEVDVRAKDAAGRVFQVEVQLDPGGALAERMIYGAGKLYASTLGKGEEYENLKPVVAIWLLRDRLPRGGAPGGGPLTDYRMRDPEGQTLGPYPTIAVIELKKWRESRIIQSEMERWLYFFSHGKELSLSDELPEQIRSEVFMKAVGETKRFNDSWTKRMVIDQWEDAARLRLTRENAWKRQVESDTRELAALRQEIAEGKQEIAEGRRELAEGKQELAEGKQELAEGKRELAEGKQEIAEGKQELEEGRRELEARERELAREKAALEARREAALKALVDTGISPADAARLLGDAPS